MQATMASIRYKTLVLFSIAAICVSLLSLLSCHLLPSYAPLDPVLRLPSEISGRRLKAGGDDSVGTRWAIPIAGSSGCGNYRHQWDDCLSSQSDVDLVDYWNEFLNSPEGSSKKLDAQKELLDILTHRVHVDNSLNLIGKLLFGSEKGIQVLSAVQNTGQPLVDDWACLSSMIRIFETHCGSLSDYGMKYIRSFVNICNAGISNETMAKVSAEVCSQIPSTRRSSLHRGFSV
ncbi:vacuolar-processing enzyme-like isoform X2 [Dendrobium catenatum]|uniref:vacuolar-processing enzyme-like isoform X2 n=1 Tax=Dendrobium catenatum TaxID=906689 RepID=UPI00109F5CF2|nr:vacuolar-processing enzyme-like isoform X2 [Dendrobium catenatum]